MDFDYTIHLPIRESYKLKYDGLNVYDGKTIKRHPRFRCMKTERDTDLNIYISCKLMSIPTYTKILKDYLKKDLVFMIITFLIMMDKI